MKTIRREMVHSCAVFDTIWNCRENIKSNAGKWCIPVYETNWNCKKKQKVCFY